MNVVMMQSQRHCRTGSAVNSKRFPRANMFRPGNVVQPVPRVQSYRKSEGLLGTLDKNASSGSLPEDADFLTKVKAAWRIFFPERKSLSPKEEGKKRLRMILVADRCGMSSDSLVGMRESIVQAMTNYVEIEASEAVEVNMSMDPEVGTIYSVAVPVKRVKPTFRPRSETVARGPNEWDPEDPNSNPADQFPWGT